MELRKGAETIVDQCLDISENEKVFLVNDGNDMELIRALKDVLNEWVRNYEYYEYPEPQNHGTEPPKKVAKGMRESDVFIAPTQKSISHTRARVKACENGARGATLPGINKEIWNSSLKADYQRVKEISEKVYGIMEETSEIRVVTDSGTDLRFDMDAEHFHTDTGLIHEPGEFGNLPAGEADGGVLNARGKLVIDHMPFVPERNYGGELVMEGSRIVDWNNLGDDSEIVQAIKNVDGVRNVAEFGFGTNPDASIIGNILQDEKVLGTVHVAIGDNTSYFPEEHEKRVSSDIHWDTLCIEPTVYFDDRKMLDKGEPTFL